MLRAEVLPPGGKRLLIRRGGHDCPVRPLGILEDPEESGGLMVVSPEAAAVAKAGSGVLRSVTDRAAGTPAWPNMHEALMELHEILREWCEAAKATGKVVGR